MTHVAFYLKNAEAELAFAEPNASDVFHSASEPLGALIEDETVLSATNKARQAGVRPSMHLRTATAFAPGLSLLRADRVRLPDFLKALRARLAPFVSSMQFVQNPFETDSVLLTAKCLTNDRRLIQKAALSPLTPKALRIGFGPTESDALVSAVTGRQLTLETAASMKIAELFPDRISQTVPVEFTLGGLLSDSTASADSPSLTTLRSLLRGDSDCFTVLPLESTFSFRKEGRSASPESATEARLCEAAYALAGWLQARRIHPGRVTLTLETANGDAVTTCEPTSSEAQVLASELLRRLRQTPHEAVTALTLTADTKRASEEHAPAVGLAADLIGRIGSGRVFRLQGFSHPFPGSNTHISANAFGTAQPFLPTTEPIPAMVRKEAVLLEDEDGLPVWESRLTLLDSPSFHRVGSETREYRTAQTSAGRRVWIWRTPGKTNWHLQGYF